MSGKKGGLGRGLGALIPTSSPSKPVENSSLKEVKDQVSEVSTPPSAPVDNSQSSLEGLLHLATVPLTSISANPRQPRQIFEPEALAELTASIKEVMFHDKWSAF